MNGIAQLNMLPEHLHQALDGYPVEELFHMGLDPSSARRAVPGSTRWTMTWPCSRPPPPMCW
jgi:hypothetical protein